MYRRCLLVALLLLLLPSATMRAQAKPKEGKKAKPVVVPVFSLSKPYTELPVGDDLLLGMSGQESFQQLIARLKKVRDDDAVKAIVLLGGSTGLGRGQIEEVRKVMDQIKDAGKEIHAHVDQLTMRGYLLLSGASQLSVVPTGDIWMTGIYAESLHLRGLLDKIHVTPDFLTCGAYKSAAELFTRTEPSREADENMNWLLDGLFDCYVRLIADGRHQSPETVRQWIDTGLYSPLAAKKAGVIDAVEYRRDFENRLKSKLGDNLKFDRKYGKKKGLDIDFSSPFGVLKFYAELLSGPKKPTSGKDAVAVVYVEGPIMPGKSDPSSFPFGSAGIAYSTPLRKALDKVAEDKTVKAVVLRVNSPGGSAVASEIILQATQRVKQNKPLVVSMGDVAGSGGYYVACAADTIFADPSTITASIGVVGGKLATTRMWNGIGINFKPYERGENAGILSSGEPFTDAQRQALQSWMNEVYGQFKDHVLSIRKDRLTKDLEQLAGGRVYTGQQALELGLVDRLGGLDDAIEHVAKAAGLKDYEIRIAPRPKGFAELLMESFQGGDADDSRLSLRRPGGSGVTGTKSIAEMLMPYLRGLDPDRIQAVTVALTQLEILRQEQISLTMPVINLRDR